MTAIRRNIKNMVHNYSDAKVKVREATSNDPWGPSSTLMAEISEMTYNVMAYTEIMSMIWKRLNDKNRNWRHVYKALTLLDYLVKTGSERVAQQCKENLFVIQSLRDFQYIEEAKDHGLNVREKAKQMVALLKDDEKLRVERASALRTRERLHQTGMGGGALRYRRASESAEMPRRPASTAYGGSAAPDGGGGRGGGHAEDVELELALALSKEVHAEEVKRREAEGLKDDMRLKMALEASKKDDEARRKSLSAAGPVKNDGNGLLDFVEPAPSAAFSIASSDPWATAAAAPPSSAAAWSDPWSTPGQTAGNGAFSSPAAASFPAWSAAPPVSTAASGFDSAFAPSGAGGGFSSSADPWNVTGGAASAAADGANSSSSGGGGAAASFGASFDHQPPPPRAKSAHGFLGDHGDLVNLDSLVTKPKDTSTNPFAPGSAAMAANPFYANQPAQPTLAELQRRAHGGFAASSSAADAGPAGLPPPLIKAPAPPPQQQPPGVYPASFNPWGGPPSGVSVMQHQQQQQHQLSNPASFNPFM